MKQKLTDFFEKIIEYGKYAIIVLLIIAPIAIPIYEEINDSSKAKLQKYQTTTANTEYILNKSTHVFHKPNCGAVRQMDTYNIWEYVGTRDDIIAMGYAPCGRCEP